MSWFDNRRISVKVGLVLGCTLLLGAAGGSVAIRAVDRAEELNDQLTAATSDVRELRALQLAVESLDGARTDYLTTLNPEWRSRAKEEIQRIDQAIANVTAMDQSAQDEPVLVAVQSWVDGTVDPALAAADLVANGQAPRSSLARFLSVAQNPAAHDKLTEELTQFISVEHAQGIRDRISAQLSEELRTTQYILYGVLLLIAASSTILLVVLGRNLSRRFSLLEGDADRIGAGKLDSPITVVGRDELGSLGTKIDAMRTSLARARDARDSDDRVQATLLGISRAMQSESDARTADNGVLTLLAMATEAPRAVLFEASRTDGETLLRIAAVGASDGHQVPARISFGEGLVGQAAADQKARFIEAPSGYVTVASALGAAKPAQIAVIPCVAGGTTLGVLEFATFESFEAEAREVLTQSADLIGLHLAVRQAQDRTLELLEEAQAQSEELQSQAEELQAQTEELESQSRELEDANVGLEEGAAQLEEQQAALAERNVALEQAHHELLLRTEIVDQASAYKSAFLAKMSHELRTPLNSVLILSERLVKDPESLPVDRRVEFAATINACGKDLLALINDVLDLSKVEAGKIDIAAERVPIEAVCATLDRQFRPLAEEKSLALGVTVMPATPDAIVSDRLRVEQILKNLLSNAVKFTIAGSVDLTVDVRGDFVCFTVADTGSGIAEENLATVFEPFKQLGNARGHTTAGTGLGLSIAQELARKMGGDLVVRSEPGVGSQFELTLPIAGPPAASVASSQSIATGAPEGVGSAVTTAPPPAPPPPGQVQVPQAPGGAPQPSAQGVSPSTRAPGVARVPGVEPAVATQPSGTDPDASLLLVIEDDPLFASLIADEARALGFRTEIAGSGQQALTFLAERAPDAITLDLGLPDMDGWVLLDRIRHDQQTRHTPVQIISGSESALAALGVNGTLIKPAASSDIAGVLHRFTDMLAGHARRVVVVESDPDEANAVSALLRGGDLDVQVFTDVDAALPAIRGQGFDAVVVDLATAGDHGPAVLQELRQEPLTQSLPVIVFYDPDETSSGLAELKHVASAVIAKDQSAHARLIDETIRFLHRVSTDLPAEQQEMVAALYERDPDLAGRVVLVVDDDPRNVFSLATILEQHELEVVDAEDGQEALAVLAERSDVELVLMDVMMPVMDGLEATRRIRANPATAHLPVISVTALAMPEDRARSLASGASDYLTKPIDADQLVSLIRVWLGARTR
jgi:signal transduction histidine kinase/DNA-binding response OmpR family regulator/HAMP domain-containing protein